MSLRVKLLTENAVLPSRATEGSVGYDLHSAYDYVIYPKERKLIKTDIAVNIPLGFYGRIAPRSSLALKHSVDVAAGVIDSDYRGNVGVVLCNNNFDPSCHSKSSNFVVKKGDRIAQLIITACDTPPVLQVEELDNTERNEGGFGSTGV